MTSWPLNAARSWCAELCVHRPEGSADKRFGHVGKGLDADRDDDPPSLDALDAAHGELESVAGRGDVGDRGLFDFQAAFGLEPLAVVDEVVEGDREPVAGVGLVRLSCRRLRGCACRPGRKCWTRNPGT